MSDAIIKSVNTGGRGITSYMQYDALNRLISVDDASIDTDGSRVLVGYDGFGNIIEYENEEGAVTLYTT